MRTIGIASLVIVVLANISTLLSQSPVNGDPGSGKIAMLEAKIDSLEEKVDTLESKLKSKESPVKLSIGASFDFLSGQSATDLYYDISFFQPALWKNDPKKFWQKIGLDFSFYQTRLFGDSIQLTLDQQPRAYALLNPDTILAESYTLLRERKTTFENIGVFLSPTFKIRDHIYGILHFEAILQSETVFFNDTYDNIDSTLRIAVTDYIETTHPLRNILPGEKKSERINDFRWFVGAGLMLDLPIGDIRFRIKPVMGYMQIQPWLTNGRSSNQLEGGFYDITLQLIETNSGIKFGAEVRNMFKSKEFPNYSIFLSKQFALSKLGDFIKSK